MKNNNDKTKFLHLILFSIFTILLITSCSSNMRNESVFKPLAKIEQTSTINFVGHWLNEGDREEFVRNIARVYEFENQNVKVNLKFPEETFYDELDRKSNEKYTAKVIAEGLTDWDILRINGEYREVNDILHDPNWARKGLVDFSEIDEFRQGTVTELLTDEAKKDWNGIIPGPYVEGQYWALWVNKEVAKKIGIEVKQFGMTFDDFSGYLKATHNYNLSHPEDHIIPLFESYVWETTMALAINLYASLFDDPKEFILGEISVNRLNAWRKTLEAIESISKYEPVDPSWQQTEWSDSHNMLPDGKCLFYINGSWMYNIWKGIDKVKVLNCMPTEFPSFKSHKIYPAAYQITWGVPKNAPNKDEAIKFLLAMNKPTIAEMWSRYTKCPTGIKGNLANASFGGDQFEVFSRYVQDNFGTRTYRYYASSAWILDNAHFETPIYFREVLDGKITAKEAMRAIKRSVGL